ncbi:MAG: FtsX-like permease family protein [Xanthomonadales bacterium]|nr:FtsX-like permease family protein [Xanthomonadales bacterium]
MEIRPILSAMLRNKTGAILIALQIAFTLAVVTNAFFIIYQRWEKINRPSGMDMHNIVTSRVQWVGQDVDYKAEILRDLEALKAIPGVTHVTTSNAIPLSGGGSSRGVSAERTEDTEWTATGSFLLTQDGLDSLGLNLVSGRNFTLNDVVWFDPEVDELAQNVIITQALAEHIYPDENAVGKTLYMNDSELTVIGIVERMHGSWVSWSGLERNMLVPMVFPGSSISYIIRTQPGLTEEVRSQVKQTLLDINNRRVIRRIRVLEDVATSSYGSDSDMMVILSSVVCLLLLITVVGIVGLAAFSVNQRTRQIGTRRALGARRYQILRYFLVENWLITSIGLTLGVLLASAFNYYLVVHFELERLDWFYIPMGMAILWLLGLFAVYGPARRASMVSPAIATRTV